MEHIEAFALNVDKFTKTGFIKPNLAKSFCEALEILEPKHLKLKSIKVWLEESANHPDALQPVLCGIQAIRDKAAKVA